MRWEEAAQLSRDVTFLPGWRLVVFDATKELQWEWASPCSLTGEDRTWSSRAWSIRNMDRDAIIKTAFAAAKMAVEHEAMEFFRYRGVAVFNPHTPLAALQQAQGAEA